MNITLLSINITTQPNNRGGTYQQADVAFKNNTFQGKVEGKKVVSFGTSEAAFKVLATAQPGENYDVEQVKENGFNVWKSLTKAGAVAKTETNVAKAAAVVKSTYETPEERKERQRSIIRQSSLGHAVATLAVGAKAVKPSDVIAIARQYEAYVTEIGGQTGFDDVPDFDPEFKPE
jgi:hypothetical protein